ncbi:hypothetical protein DFH06DRAFT_1319277 [Mycena polygramma]|nr:hypothetical protein DFH06DRAFT_1319277 [Mycena polygramma]
MSSVWHPPLEASLRQLTSILKRSLLPEREPSPTPELVIDDDECGLSAAHGLPDTIGKAIPTDAHTIIGQPIVCTCTDPTTLTSGSSALPLRFATGAVANRHDRAALAVEVIAKHDVRDLLHRRVLLALHCVSHLVLKLALELALTNAPPLAPLIDKLDRVLVCSHAKRSSRAEDADGRADEGVASPEEQDGGGVGWAADGGVGPQPIRPTQENIQEKNARPTAASHLHCLRLLRLLLSTAANAAIDALLAVDPGARHQIQATISSSLSHGVSTAAALATSTTSRTANPKFRPKVVLEIRYAHRGLGHEQGREQNESAG